MIYKVTICIVKTLVLVLFVASCAGSDPLRSQSDAVVSESVSCLGTPISERTGSTTQAGLITSAKRLYSQACFNAAVSAEMSQGQSALVVFITGRGRHPAKTFRKRIIEDLYRDYGKDKAAVGVLVFTWPSWSGIAGFPVEAGISSGKEFGGFVNVLAKHPALSKPGMRILLLTQSMGSFVLEGYVNETPVAQQPQLFSAAILSAAASESPGHELWLSKFALTQNVYVVSNNNDYTLGRLTKWQNLPPRLGQEKLLSGSRGVVYCDFTEFLGRKHKYYIDRGNASRNAFRLYRHALWEDDVFVSEQCRIHHTN